VSHETIYRSLFVQTRGVLKKALLSHLRSKRSMRRSKPVDPNGDRRGHIEDIVSIRQRPATVEDRAVPGHWEGDLLSGPNNSYIATLVERHTRYVMLAKVAGKDTCAGKPYLLAFQRGGTGPDLETLIFSLRPMKR
jgi:IS30 family transposase